jgi:hypothetical protein
MGGDVEHTPSGTCKEHYQMGCQRLLLLAYLMSMDGVICNDGIVHKF